VAAEYLPYVRTGGLAEAVTGLADGESRAGHDVVVLVPLYGAVDRLGRDLRPVGELAAITIGARTVEVRFVYDATAPRGGPQVVFVDAPACFGRSGVYGDEHDYPDNPFRFALFARAALTCLMAMRPDVTVVHAHDWHAALVPLLMRHDPAFAAALGGAAALFTVHNAGYQGRFAPGVAAELGLAPVAAQQAMIYGQFNYLLAGLAHADAVITVSPTHAAELRTEMGGFGLHRAFIELGPRLYGICNGIDQSLWDPVRDPHTARPYAPDALDGKAECKAALQCSLNLTVRPDVPVFAMLARLVEQKGFDLVLSSHEVRSRDAHFVFVGEGEARYRDGLAALVASRPANVAAEFAFTDAREHQVLAGADVLMMPSLYEPCGLTQMRAQRYGALVVARDVGGLHDTVTNGETGFVFGDYTPHALDGAIWRAMETFGRADEWQRMMRAAMARDFDWQHVTRRYAEVCQAALARVAGPPAAASLAEAGRAPAPAPAAEAATP
jgi:starch synthase